jgi:predicted type IV restriction endonuclease
MEDSLADLLRRVRDEGALLLSGEEAAKQGAVLPILSRLGWDRDNIREVVPEYAVANGRVDYCLRIHEKAKVFVEAKRASEELAQHQEQLLDYAFRQGVQVAVLTNGLVWWLYLPLLEGSWEQRRFFTIDIQQQEPEEASQNFRGFLGRDEIANGDAISRAQRTHESREKSRRIREAIPRAWQQLCEEPDEQLLELFSDRVESACGYRPPLDDLAEYLANTLRQQIARTLNTNQEQMTRPPPAGREA